MLVAETMLGILGLLDEGARGRQRELGFAKSTLGARRAARHDVAHNSLQIALHKPSCAVLRWKSVLLRPV